MHLQRKHYFARIPTLALLILLAIAPELAVILFIVRAIDRSAEKKEEQAARERAQYAADFRPQDTRDPRPGADPAAAPAYDYSAAYSAPPQAHDIPTAEQQKAKNRHQKLTTLCAVAGGVLLFIGAVSLPEAFQLIAAFGLGSGLGDLLAAIFQIAGGGGALAASLALKRASKLERRLDKVVGDRDNIPLEELFAAAGVPYKEGRKTLESAIDHGYFGADAYIDNRTDFLVVRGAAPIPAEPEPEPAPGGESQYQRLLRQLREAGRAIPDPVIRGKVGRLEELSARIFALAEEDPAKEEQLRKFISYYLPTALRLLNTYAQLERQGVDGENITRTRQQIERSLDLLVTAFENQLDKLFQSDALDVSADVAALEGMLNLDGLAGESDFSPQL